MLNFCLECGKTFSYGKPGWTSCGPCRGKEKHLTRKKIRISFHVLAVTLCVKYIDQEKSFWGGPVTDQHLDYYFGMFAWNHWFFNEFKTAPELDPKKLACTYTNRRAC
jgi:hypothetical protein